MRNRNLLYLFLTAILVFACNLPAAAPVTAPPQAQETATFTPAPAAAVTDTIAPTISTAPFASPNSDALNCRTGPSTNYDVAAVLALGQKVEIVGKTSDGSWLDVKNPFLPGNLCWVSAGFVTTTGDLSGLQIVAVPPTSTSSPNSKGAITFTSIDVIPDTIHVGGCIGPIQPVTVSVKIKTSGSIKINVRFKDEQVGDIYSSTLNFSGVDSKNITKDFTPKVKAGTFKVTLIIEGYDTSGLNTVAKYKITC